MCVIIHKPAGVTIPKTTLVDCYDANPDGFGVSYYRSNGKLKIIRGMFDDDMICKVMSSIDPSIECVLHFRWATHGSKSKKNCHPFKVHSACGTDFALSHNGILPVNTDEYPDYSDTYHFARSLERDTWSIAELVAASDELEKFHGSGNRLALHFPQRVMRTGSWHELDGCYFSNLNWQWSTRATKYSTERYSFADDAGFYGEVADEPSHALGYKVPAAWQSQDCESCGRRKCKIVDRVCDQCRAEIVDEYLWSRQFQGD